MKLNEYKFKGGWGNITIEAPTKKAAKQSLSELTAKTLYLTVHKKAFEVMVTSEKKEEYRKPSKWITSRLFDKNMQPKKYDFVKITNGYKKDSPYFIAQFHGLSNWDITTYLHFSNGLKVQIEAGDIIIKLGRIIEQNTIIKSI